MDSLISYLDFISVLRVFQLFTKVFNSSGNFLVLESSGFVTCCKTLPLHLHTLEFVLDFTVPLLLWPQ